MWCIDQSFGVSHCLSGNGSLLQSKPERGGELSMFLSVFLAEGEALKPFLVPIPKPSPHLLRTRVQERLKITCLCGPVKLGSRASGLPGSADSLPE